MEVTRHESQLDDWVRNHLEAYVNWAMTHNSLFILTFDEDNNLYQNRIPTIFVGPMVQSGNYLANGYHHYDHFNFGRYVWPTLCRCQCGC